ncbi:MAG: nucleotidyltransferase domain-containing protein [Nitrospirae bacterium]|nr:nucleotidyltransferase domain-containing protein [Nitrospirota bacterium]
MEQRFELTNNEIEEIKQKLISTLTKHTEVSFAYLHGSFGSLPFRDIDIGAYCIIPEDAVFDFELEMSSELGIASGYTVDFKVINYAPIGFQFSVINEGILLFERDKNLRLNFVEEIGLRYMDYFEFSKSYFKELMECIEK